MRHQCTFDFGGAKAMAGDVDNVIDAPRDPVISVLVSSATVTGDILARIVLEIRVDETLMVAVDRAHLARPGFDDAQVAAAGAFNLFAFCIDDLRHDAEEWARRPTWLEFGCARQWRDQDAAGLGLPPGVDDRAAIISDDMVIPFPSFRIDRLADRAEQAKRLTRRFFDRVVAPLHQRADGSRRRVDNIDLVLVAHLPEA